MRFVCLTVLLAGLLSLATAEVFRTPVVQTPYGALSGRMDQNTYAFLGIPFAAPPVGNLRFAPPEEPSPWSGVLNATQFAAGCLAPCSRVGFPRPSIMCTPTRSEDCLYLNVYTPTLNTTANLPVIMFMHGGNYEEGSGGVPLYDGSNLAGNQDVVVVTINYRLGMIGGLYTGTVQGNFQTMDQRQAMKWIQKTITAFGGNPNLVTITGQSAGAFSVATHLSSPKSWPYFQRAIIVSNPFSLPAADPEMAIKLGTKVLSKLGCPVGGDAELACLRAANATTLMELSSIDYTPLPWQILGVLMQWVPVVDGDELPYQPLHALTNGNFSKVPILFGTVANESVQFIYAVSKTPLSHFGYDILIDAIFGFELAAKVKAEYGPLPPQYYNDSRNWVSVPTTDYIFYCVNRHVGAALTQLTPTFMYLFDRLGSWNEWTFGQSMPYCVSNVCHASDLPFIFNPFHSPLIPANETVPVPTEAEYGLIHFLQTAWGNFARSGNPSTGRTLPHANGVTWPIFDGLKNHLVNLSSPVNMLDGYRNQQCAFWDKQGYYRW